MEFNPFGFRIVQEESLHPGTAHLVDLSKLEDMVLLTSWTFVREELREVRPSGFYALRAKCFYELRNRHEFLPTAMGTAAGTVVPIEFRDPGHQ